MASIRPLSDSVRRKLRSGIVVSSLGQVAEELLCNSIDAASTKIDLKVDTDSFTIQVDDNGCGMSRDDLVLLGTSHATSKLTSLSELDDGPKLLGFRGEALHSIMELSLVEIVTKTKECVHTYRKICKGENVLTLGMASNARKPGTTVIVRDVFFNQPVRRRQLVSRDSKEVMWIKDRFVRLALVRPSIDFELVITPQNERILLPPATSAVDRLNQLTGEAWDLEKIHARSGIFQVSGYASRQGQLQHAPVRNLYVNRRFVSANSIARAIKQAYMEAEPLDGSNPSFSYVLNIECPYSNYDITFEPDKTYVEFNDWQAVLVAIRMALGNVWKPSEEMLGPLPGTPSTEVHSSPHAKRRRTAMPWQRMDPSYRPSHQGRSGQFDEMLTPYMQPSLHEHLPCYTEAPDAVEERPALQLVTAMDFPVAYSPERASSYPGGFEARSGALTAAEVDDLLLTTHAETERNFSQQLLDTLGGISTQDFTEAPSRSWGSLRRCDTIVKADTSMCRTLCADQTHVVEVMTEAAAPLQNHVSSDAWSPPEFPDKGWEKPLPSRLLQGPSIPHSQPEPGPETFAAQPTTQELCQAWRVSARHNEHDKPYDVLEISPKTRCLNALTGGPSNVVVPSSVSRNTLGSARFIQQIDKKFIAATSGSHFFLVDQHAADERILLEELRHKVLHAAVPHERTLLPSPVRLQVGPEAVHAMEENREKIERWGWTMKPTSAVVHTIHERDLNAGASAWADSVTVYSVPRIMETSLSPKDLEEYAHQLVATKGSSAEPASVSRLLNSKACRGAIMFGDALLPSQCKQLLSQLKETNLPFQCAHGRPTTVPIVNLVKLKQQFCRLEIDKGAGTACERNYAGPYSFPCHTQANGWHGLVHKSVSTESFRD